MNLFNSLLVAHLIADWMLQNDWMARNKQQRWLNPAILVHCSIYTVILLLALWFGESMPTPQPRLLVAAVLFVSHWLIDAGDWARLWMRLLRQSPSASVRIMVDQTMHLLVIAGLIQWLLL